jgi:ABC-type uncharacterized transport system YnjBCD ATPase subunit
MRGVLTGLAKRRLGEVVEARLAEEPVVVLNGPRTVGKSTLLSQLAAHLGRAVMQLAVGVNHLIFPPDRDDVLTLYSPAVIMAAIALCSAHRPQPEVSTQTPA